MSLHMRPIRLKLGPLTHSPAHLDTLSNTQRSRPRRWATRSTSSTKDPGHVPSNALEFGKLGLPFLFTAVSTGRARFPTNSDFFRRRSLWGADFRRPMTAASLGLAEAATQGRRANHAAQESP